MSLPVIYCADRHCHRTIDADGPANVCRCGATGTCEWCDPDDACDECGVVA